MNDKTNFFMNRAIDLATKNIDVGGGPFGAVIVKDNNLIAEAANHVVTSIDPTAHAEIEAIRRASTTLGTHDLSGCEIYSSCEPCPMCLGAIYWAHIDTLWFACSRKDAADAGFDDQFIYDQLNLPFTRRRIETKQIMAKQASNVFTKWKQYSDKIRY